jgi:hypothetical protein
LPLQPGSSAKFIGGTITAGGGMVIAIAIGNGATAQQIVALKVRFPKGTAPFSRPFLHEGFLKRTARSERLA